MNKTLYTEINDQRIDWVDSLKAIGIFFVVMAHHDKEIPWGLVKYIYSFHIPLFFFISGFLFRPAKYATTGNFIIRRLRTLILPYFVFSLISYVLMLGFQAWQNGLSSIELSDLAKSIVAIFISANDIIPMPNRPMWFITCLFTVEVLFYFIHKLTTYNRSTQSFLIATIILLSSFGILYDLNVTIRLAWGIDTAFNAFPFYGAGFLISRKYISQMGRLGGHKAVLLVLLLLLVTIWLYDKNGIVNLGSNRTGGNFIFFYLTSFSAITSLIIINMVIPKIDAVEYIGKNSIIILAFHSSAYSLVWRIPLISTYLISAPSWARPLNIGLVSILQIIFTIPAIYIITHYFPYIIGRTFNKTKV
jgi:acyltransferase